MSIDIGADAIDREYAFNNAIYRQCYIEGHPATVSETVRTIRMFIKGNLGVTYLQVGALYKTNGNVFSSRPVWGEVLYPGGSGLFEWTQWRLDSAGPLIDIELEVQAGDYIGVRMWPAAAGNGIAIDSPAGLGLWRTLTEDVSFPFINKTFNFLANYEMSLNGEMTPVIILPTVTTDPATSVAATTATLNGPLDNDGGEACDCGFEWGETIAYGNTTPTQSRTTGQTFSQVISGLDPNTTYHFRAFATNAAGTSYGADRTFTTLIALSTVTTQPVTGRGMVIASFNGLLDADGGEACVCGFEWGADITYGATTSTETKVTGEAFSQRILGLFPGTEYHYRAFATNSAGTSYGDDESFRSEPGFSRAYALAREEL